MRSQKFRHQNASLAIPEVVCPRQQVSVDFAALMQYEREPNDDYKNLRIELIIFPTGFREESQYFAAD